MTTGDWGVLAGGYVMKGSAAVGALLIGALALPAPHSRAAAGPHPVRACATLAAISFADGSRVTSAADVPANGSTPAYCSVTVQVPERINVSVLLPDDNWNGRYRAEGGGVYEGVLIPPTSDVALGYAASSTDTGHQSALLTGEWAWSPAGPNYHQIQDFGYRAHHETAVHAKALIEAYYGRGRSTRTGTAARRAGARG